MRTKNEEERRTKRRTARWTARCASRGVEWRFSRGTASVGYRSRGPGRTGPDSKAKRVLFFLRPPSFPSVLLSYVRPVLLSFFSSGWEGRDTKREIRLVGEGDVGKSPLFAFASALLARMLADETVSRKGTTILRRRP